jgi:hypothetical protein
LTLDCSDMRDYVDSDAALQERFGWDTMQTPQTDERQRFEEELRAWQDWAQEHQDSVSTTQFSGSPSLNIQNRSRSHTVPLQDFRSSVSSSQRNSASHSSRSGSQPRRGDMFVSPASAGPKSSIASSISSQSTLAPPTQRISRSMRVFVAWKDPSTTTIDH